MDDSGNHSSGSSRVFSSRSGLDQTSSTELPFLVTNWLANYADLHTGDDARNQERDEAIHRLRRAASEIASAFSTLGAFGVSHQLPRAPSEPGLAQPPSVRNSTFSDLARRWPRVEPHWLQRLVDSAAIASDAANLSARRVGPAENLVQEAQEAKPRAEQPGAGRRLGTGTESLSSPRQEEKETQRALSILQAPTLFSTNATITIPASQSQTASNKAEESSIRLLPLPVKSDVQHVSARSAKSMRKFLDLREKVRAEQAEVTSIERSLLRHRQCRESLFREKRECQQNPPQVAALVHESAVSTLPVSSTMSQLPVLVELEEKIQNHERVIAQLERQLSEKRRSVSKLSPEMVQAETEARLDHRTSRVVIKEYNDPFESPIGNLFPATVALGRQRLLFSVTARQYGASGRMAQRSIGRVPGPAAISTDIKALLKTRMNHALTVNAHLSLPVFCVKFDRTGRYFVTGSDDGLVKLFCLGAGKSISRSGKDDSRELKFSYGANENNAILVCTLRGHAGVICDIDVSPDNAFVATASGDGDCRVWGLKDGCPIAILRGHVGGANMVSWSDLTPYRLVTVGDDGYARAWDIREAALKRYGAYIGKRAEYVLPFENKDSQVNGVGPQRAPVDSNSTSRNEIILPPLPVRNTNQGGVLQGVVVHGAHVAGEMPTVGEGQDVQMAIENPSDDNNIDPGAFVANDMIDEGVKLLAKLQHGETLLEQPEGPGTRSRRKGVRIICLARCPLGNHFVTGSDDGICRIWLDDEDDRLSACDHRFLGLVDDSGAPRHGMPARSTNHIEGLLLAKLTGHMNAITDLDYSHAGDRLLTGSQKDGVARVWSWRTTKDSNYRCIISDLKQVVLRLQRLGPVRLQNSRRRSSAASSGSSTGVVLDGAVWTCDDSNIITAQCCPIKEGSSDIEAGSQYILVWDSRKGQCLMGVSNAHKAQCHILVPHPKHAYIVCSAGSDGFAKLWDLESGTCFQSHENTVDYGCMTASDRGKHSAYVEGLFSPDGLRLILTDDHGRFSLFDTLSFDTTTNSVSSPFWLREQYFASDYYELVYDTNGYCVERGSRQPPHLAPRAARCSYNGSPWSEDINDTFGSLCGPLPVDEKVCRWKRDNIRERASIDMSRQTARLALGNRRTIIMGEFDSERTVLISEYSSPTYGEQISLALDQREAGVVTGFLGGIASHARASANAQRNASSSRRNLSSNFHWIDYDERFDDDDDDDRNGETVSSDEDFVAPGRGRSDADDEELSEGFASESSASGGLRNRGTRARARRRSRRGRDRERETSLEERVRSQPTRASARQASRGDRSKYLVPDSDEEIGDFEAVVSTNNTLSGPHVEDFTRFGHYFRLPEAARVHRKWLQRIESDASNAGRKAYAPQVGDSVVYIPQAHLETLQRFPILEHPWRSWSSGARWPLLRCRVRDIRYRFPYESCFRSQNPEDSCRSIVAILTLEVTGIPEMASDPNLPWPSRFIQSRQTRSSTQSFEVHLFESVCADFVLPENLFLRRLQSLAEAVHRNNSSVEGIQVLVFFRDENESGEDLNMKASPGKLLRIEEQDEQQFPAQIRGSGIGSLRVEWEEPGWGIDSISPWEVDVTESTNDVASTRLSNEEKDSVAVALSKIAEKSSVKRWFLHRVNGSIYSDYFRRIEVPMHIQRIEERFKADYYSNIESLLADMRLVRDNCIKYNGAEAELSKHAEAVYDEFERLLTAEGLLVDRDVSSPDDQETQHRGNAAGAQLSEVPQVERPRRRSRNLSSLEQLPRPDEAESREEDAQSSTNQDLSRSRRRRRRGATSLVMAGDESAGERQKENTNGPSSQSSESSQVGDDEFEGDESDFGQSTEEETFHESDDVSEAVKRPRISIRRSKVASVLEGHTGGSTRSERHPRSQASSRRKSDQQEDSDASFASAEVYTGGESSEAEPERQRSSRRSVKDERDAEGPRRSPRTRVNKPKAHLSHSKVVEENLTEEGAPPAARTRSKDARRRTFAAERSQSRMAASWHSPRSRVHKSMADLSNSEVPEESSSEEKSIPVARTTRRSRGQGDKTAEKKWPTRRSSLHSRIQSTADSGHSEDENRDSEVECRSADWTNSTNGSTKRAAERSACSPSSVRRSRRSKVTRSISSFSEVGEEASSGDEATAVAKSTSTPRGQKRLASKYNSSKRAKRAKHDITAPVLPELKQWPSIDIKEITDVSKEVLQRMMELDGDDLFSKPVVEMYPNLKKSYLKKIKRPMDFRTIMEDKLHEYESIRELQDDLILIFRNSTDFNMPGDPVYLAAVHYWEQINDIFRDVCKDLRILLPRRW